MKNFIAKKSVGFYFLLIAIAAAIIATIQFATWAPAHKTTDTLLMVVLVLGIAVDVILMFFDNDYLTILATIFYSIGFFRLLVDSVGSFVDKLQGIVMFGDSSQVGTIIMMAAIIGISVAASIIASFLRRVKMA